MKVYFKNRKQKIRAKSYMEIIQWMKDRDYQQFSDIEEFMQEYSYRKKMFEKKHINTTSVEDFVNSLIQHEIIEIN